MQVRRIFVEKRHEHAAEARFLLSDLKESLHLEGLRTVRQSMIDSTLYELLAAYGAIHGRSRVTPWTPHDRGQIMTLEDALQRLSGLIGQALDWTELKRFLPGTEDQALARSTLASSFVAALELARTGAAELSQAEAFGPLMLRIRSKG